MTPLPQSKQTQKRIEKKQKKWKIKSKNNNNDNHNNGHIHESRSNIGWHGKAKNRLKKKKNMKNHFNRFKFVECQC